MKQLLLLRHAKSSWSNPGMPDFDRPLNDRGNAAAQAMACYLAHEMPLPDRIFVSSSQRTRETLGHLLNAYAHEIDVRIERRLYLAPSLALLEAVRAGGEEAETVMLIGHNPGTEELALNLAGDQNSEQFNAMMMKYPTAACAHFQLDVDSWRHVSANTACLMNFIRPKDLM